MYALIRIISPVAADGPICTVQGGGSDSTDDAPAVIKAFDDCGKGGTVNFANQTYYINSVMNISGVEDCDVNLGGTLLVC